MDNNTAEVKGHQKNTIDNKKAREKISEIFWNNVTTMLKYDGHNKAWLSEQTGIRQQTMNSASYQKTSVNLYTLVRISEALGCKAGDLIEGTPESIIQNKSIEESKEQALKEVGTPSVKALITLFTKLDWDSQLAVLVHMLSLKGVSPYKTLSYFEEVYKKYATNQQPTGQDPGYESESYSCPC